jgi:cytochrome b pre-mRNA-processing protein 3
MLAALKKIWSPRQDAQGAYLAYNALVTQARSPWFYEQQRVPDTIDGRFDIVLLHLFLVIHRMEAQSPEFVRLISEAFIADMDRNLREMGVSDTGVGKRIKKMAQAFFGRMQSYRESIDQQDAFLLAISRNVYRADAPVSEAQAIYDYCLRNAAHLAAQDSTKIAAGSVRFCS